MERELMQSSYGNSGGDIRAQDLLPGNCAVSQRPKLSPRVTWSSNSRGTGVFPGAIFMRVKRGPVESAASTSACFNVSRSSAFQVLKLQSAAMAVRSILLVKVYWPPVKA